MNSDHQFFVRCSCGFVTRWITERTIIANCMGCTKCDTMLAPSPSLHEPLRDHEFVAVTDRIEKCVKCGLEKTTGS